MDQSLEQYSYKTTLQINTQIDNKLSKLKSSKLEDTFKLINYHEQMLNEIDYYSDLLVNNISYIEQMRIIDSGIGKLKVKRKASNSILQ